MQGCFIAQSQKRGSGHAFTEASIGAGKISATCVQRREHKHDIARATTVDVEARCDSFVGSVFAPTLVLRVAVGA